MSTYARLEKNGNTAFSDGKTHLVVPSESACKERLLKLLEDAGGDPMHAVVSQFWQDRAKECGDLDEMKRAWATETFKRLEKIWDGLITPPAEGDVFAAFGIFKEE